MPSSKHFFHKNRSQASLLNVQEHNDRRPYQASQTDSPLHSPAFSPHPSPSVSASASASATAVAPTSHLPLYGNEDYRQGQLNTADESRFYEVDSSLRSQSHLASQSHYVHNSSTQRVGLHPGEAASSAGEDNPDSYYQQGPPPSAPKEDRKRRFFGLGSSSASKEPVNNNGVQRLGRSISVRKKPPQISTDNSSRPVQNRWSTSVAPPASEEDEGGGAGLDPSHLQPVVAQSIVPPIPEKDPSRLSHFQPGQQDSLIGGASIPSIVTSNTTRQPLERQGSSNSSVWENPVRQHFRAQTEAQYHHPSSYQPSPSSATSTSSHPLPPAGPAESLQQYHPEPPSRPSSQHSFGPPSPIQPNYRGSETLSNRASLNSGLISAYAPPMGPSSQQQAQSRGSNELSSQNPPGVLSREGSYQPYAQNAGQNQAPNAPQYGNQLGVNTQGGGYRGVPQSSTMAQQPSTDTGRSTPPPSRSRDDLSGIDVAQLVNRHDELQDKYRKVKKYYFDKDAQVQQLQNTLAHQRLSQSRTSLDDNEYANRFSRLDGAINNLSFNIRRDWRAVPPWLAPSVNRDAPSSPTKEMTAVGRACISRWLVDELLDRFFHPALDPSLSAHLKIIEKNLRRNAGPASSEEERDALMARISNWRLATLDGLQDMLNSQQATEYKSSLTESLVEKLTASLSMSLKEPPPPGLEGGVAMIVELAVGIAMNLPSESRDVVVDYISPGTLFNETYMKIETGLPPLVIPGEGLTDNGGGEKASEDSGSVELKEVGQSEPESGAPIGSLSGTVPSVGTPKELKKKSMFGGFISSGKKGVSSSPSPAQQQQVQPPQPPKEERVRFATFMAVEVRGKSVLVKAPVYV